MRRGGWPSPQRWPSVPRPGAGQPGWSWARPIAISAVELSRRPAPKQACRRMPFRELVKLAQSEGVTDVKLLMPANQQALIDAVLTIQQKQEKPEQEVRGQEQQEHHQTQRCCNVLAIVRTLGVPAAVIATAAVASTENGREALMDAWPSVAMFCALIHLLSKFRERRHAPFMLPP